MATSVMVIILIFSCPNLEICLELILSITLKILENWLYELTCQILFDLFNILCVELFQPQIFIYLFFTQMFN